MTARQWLLIVHRGMSALVFPLLFCIGVSGALLAFADPIDDLFNGSITRLPPRAAALDVDSVVAAARTAAGDHAITSLRFPDDDRHAAELTYAGGAEASRTVLIDPGSGIVVGHEEQLVPVVPWIKEVHRRLLAGERGAAVVAWSTVLLLFIGATGLALWWPRRRLKVRLSGRPSASKLLALHETVGAYGSLALVILSATGIVIHWSGLLVRPTPPPLAAPSSCAAAAPLAAIARQATAAIPGARLTWLQVDPRTHVVRATLKLPEDRTPAGRSQVFVDGCSAAVLATRSARDAALVTRVVAQWTRPLHTGDMFGWPTRLVAAAGSLSLPMLCLTGPWLWWVRRRGRRTSAAVSRAA